MKLVKIALLSVGAVDVVLWALSVIFSPVSSTVQAQRLDPPPDPYVEVLEEVRQHIDTDVDTIVGYYIRIQDACYLGGGSANWLSVPCPSKKVEPQH